MKAAIFTLGCRTNQFDSAQLEDSLSKIGYEIAVEKETADIYIVNTCTVTQKSDTQSRRLIKRIARENPKAQIVVTGCAADMVKKNIKDYSGCVDLIVTNAEKPDIARLISGNTVQPDKDKSAVIRYSRSKTRANLKIQDGCDNSCSYCIVPKVRGKSRSVQPEWILNQLQAYEEAEVKEVVLTGIHLGDYGHDIGTSLSDILTMIIEKSKIPRIRLSSLDPDEVDDELLEFFSSERVCRHLHLAIQSCNDETLSDMNRKYKSKAVWDITSTIKKKIPGIQIGADIITGFPGETEEQFENGINLLKDSPVDYLHVFPFSPRPGTEAAKRKELFIKQAVITKRAQRLKLVSDQKKQLFLKSQMMTRHLLLLENSNSSLFSGYSDNYIRILLDQTKGKKHTTPPPANSIIAVVPVLIKGDVIIAKTP